MCGFSGYILSDNVWQNEAHTKADLSNISELIYHRGNLMITEFILIKKINLV